MRITKIRIIMLAALGALGLGTAVALGAIVTATSTSCATTTSPAHTVGVDGTPVSTVAGSTLSVCATATATATNSTDTVTTTVPGPTTTVTTTVSPPPVTSHDYSTSDPGSGQLKLVTSSPTTATNSITVAAGATSYNMTDGRNAVYTTTPGITGPQHGTYTAIVHVTSAFNGAQMRIALEQNGAFLGGGWTAFQNVSSAGDLMFTVNDTASPDWTSTNLLQLFIGVKNSNASGSGTVSWQSGGLTTLDVPFSLSPPPPSGSVLFDGSASKMNALDVHSVSGPGAPCQGGIIGPTTRGYFCVYSDPADLWSCLCFIDNDITLASDALFGKAYDVNVKTGDTNEWGASKSIDGAGQLSIRQDNDLGKWDYYAIAAKAPTWNGPASDVYFVDIASLGYQTSSNDQFGFQIANNAGVLNYRLAVNGGYANGPQGNAPGTSAFRQFIKPVTLGRWEDWVFAIKWSTSGDGEVKIYNRLPGGAWSMIFDKPNIDTYLYGTITKADGTVQNFAQDGSNWPTVIDKIGLYFQEYGGETEHVQESGLIRTSDLASAEASLP